MSHDFEVCPVGTKERLKKAEDALVRINTEALLVYEDAEEWQLNEALRTISIISKSV